MFGMQPSNPVPQIQFFSSSRPGKSYPRLSVCTSYRFFCRAPRLPDGRRETCGIDGVNGPVEGASPCHSLDVAVPLIPPLFRVPAMPNRDIVVVGASAGGIEALGEMVAGLPPRFVAALFVVQHVASDSINYLPTMLGNRSLLPVQAAVDGAPIQPGKIYVAPPNRHLLIDHEQMYLSQGPRENRMRPAVDPLFRSAALAHGPRVIGVILSGALDDGTSGLVAVKDAGGLAVVQDPKTAVTPDMPQSALDYVEVDHCVSAAEVGPLLGALSSQNITANGHEASDARIAALRKEVGIMIHESGDIPTAEELGELIPASCPECGGPLWEMDDGIPRFRCHTGHAFTARHLVAGLKEAEEQSLWVALRVMEERVRMLRRLAKKENSRNHKLAGESFMQKADEADEHVRRLRSLLTLDRQVS